MPVDTERQFKRLVDVYRVCPRCRSRAEQPMRVIESYHKEPDVFRRGSYRAGRCHYQFLDPDTGERVSMITPSTCEACDLARLHQDIVPVVASPA